MVEATIEFRGIGGRVAIRVPDGATAGSRFLYFGGRFDLAVDDSTFDEDSSDVLLPDLEIEFREVGVRGQYIVADPFAPCGSVPRGLMVTGYADVPWLTGYVPVGHTLDVTVRRFDEPAFADFGFDSGKLIQSRQPGQVNEFLRRPLGDTLDFNVHSRLVRLRDAAVSETVTNRVRLDPAALEDRFEWVGCSSTHIPRRRHAPLFALGLLFLGLALGARRRGQKKMAVLT